MMSKRRCIRGICLVGIDDGYLFPIMLQYATINIGFREKDVIIVLLQQTTDGIFFYF